MDGTAIVAHRTPSRLQSSVENEPFGGLDTMNDFLEHIECCTCNSQAAESNRNRRECEHPDLLSPLSAAAHATCDPPWVTGTTGMILTATTSLQGRAVVCNHRLQRRLLAAQAVAAAALPRPPS